MLQTEHRKHFTCRAELPQNPGNPRELRSEPQASGTSWCFLEGNQGTRLSDTEPMGLVLSASQDRSWGFAAQVRVAAEPLEGPRSSTRKIHALEYSEMPELVWVRARVGQLLFDFTATCQGSCRFGEGAGVQIYSPSTLQKLPKIK